MTITKEDITIWEGDQRTDEWHTQRLGRLSGSNAHDMLSRKKPETKARRNLRVALASERVFGRSAQSDYTNSAMEWGIEQEPHAINAYESRDLSEVTPVGYVVHKTLWLGCSPDGFVGEEGVLEGKCPHQMAVHWENLQAIQQGKIPARYLPQLRHNLWLTGREWIDFCTYYPAWADKSGMDLAVGRLHRKEAKLDDYATLALDFLKEVEEEANTMQGLVDLMERPNPTLKGHMHTPFVGTV